MASLSKDDTLKIFDGKIRSDFFDEVIEYVSPECRISVRRRPIQDMLHVEVGLIVTYVDCPHKLSQ